MNNIATLFRSYSLSIVVGIIAGVSSSVFLHALQWVTDLREQHMLILLGLPFVGFGISWIYLKYGQNVHHGHNLILEQVSSPEKIIPLRMAPMILISTLLTHLFGGSAGREGTAVQMSASLSDQLTKLFHLPSEQRKKLLVAGIGAGFGSAIGAPWAGFFFGMELLRKKSFHFVAPVEGFIASFVSSMITQSLKTPHTDFGKIVVGQIDGSTLVGIVCAAIVFGGFVRLFLAITHRVENLFAEKIPFLPLRTFTAGGIILIFFYLEGSYHYVGLGIPYIQKALLEPSHWSEPFLKLFFTSLTIGTGFKGGEFIPLVFMGTTLGSTLSNWLPVAPQLLSGLGFASLFGAATKTPLACAVMAMEIFGHEIGGCALLCCFIANFVSGPKGIYKSQQL